jgi:polyisoprenyl-phosphate glycosyltransferase
MSSQLLISVVIPVFQNAETLRKLHDRVVTTISQIENFIYEIIYVDDGSNDGSLEILEDIHLYDSNTVIIKLSRNFGQHAANNAGFRQATGDIIVNLSADLQDPPEIIEQLIRKIQEGADIALATRTKVDETIFKKWSSWLHYKLIRIEVPQFPSSGFDFWAINRKAFKAFLSFNDVNRRNQIDLLSIGYRVAEVPYKKLARKHGKSQYNFLKRLDISLSQIFATATWPMRLISAFGILLTLIGLLIAAFLFISYFINNKSYPGWTSIFILVLLIGGINSLMVGIIGEYIWRIYHETKRRPLFFVEKILKKNSLNQNGKKNK